MSRRPCRCGRARLTGDQWCEICAALPRNRHGLPVLLDTVTVRMILSPPRASEEAKRKAGEGECVIRLRDYECCGERHRVAYAVHDDVLDPGTEIRCGAGRGTVD